MRRKNRIDYEGQEQTAYFTWLYYQHKSIWEMAYHVPNGGKRNAREAARFKQQGVKAGVADIIIDIPKNGFHGFRIELKATPPHNCKVTESQQDWIGKWSSYGYFACIAIGFKEAQKYTREYFDIE